jgi:protein phosphatase 1B
MILDVPDAPGYSFFGVFDGHGGSFVSDFAAKKLLDTILNTDEWKSGDRSDVTIKEALRKGFLILDMELLQQDEIKLRDDHSGSTGVTAMVTPDKIFVANCGDSRSILVTANHAKAMSEDHKPYNPEEKARIEAAGGVVAMNRVNGDLAVSRALGDFVYKKTFTLPQEKQQVSVEPDISIHLRDKSADQYLILACDGVWDVISNEECAEYCLKKAEEGCTLMKDMAGDLIDWCLEKQSRDNMSAIVVALDSAPSLKTERNVAEAYTMARLERKSVKEDAQKTGNVDAAES